MKFLIYFLISILVLFLSYNLSLSASFIFSFFIGTLIAINQITSSPYEVVLYLLYITSLPLLTYAFKKDSNIHKQVMRDRFKAVKNIHEELLLKDKRQIESNLEKEKKLTQILSLYEISKDMSQCMAFEDIFDIFCSALKKSFRFRLSRLLLLKESKEIDSVYQIELGRRINKVAPDNFDKELADVSLSTGKTILISPQESSEFLRRLAVIKNFETLISIPLFVEEKIAGILYIENMSRAHFENFIILAAQFGIQFQKVMLYRKVQEMSITDSLTEVNTRRYFLERLSEEIRRSMRHKSNLSFLMLDLDYFKEKNDKFGHLVGDVILKEVSRILKSTLREIDVIGRYGGEEFAILLTGIDRDGAFQVAGRIRENIEKAAFKAYDEVVSTTVSIGLSVFPDNGVDSGSLIEAADRALYKAKEAGRNRVC